jgi:hypothetical protein
MSHTVPTQQPAVVLRPTYQHLRALLAIAAAAILGLTVAVVLLATNTNHGTLATPTTQSATHPNPSTQTGTKLDHSARNLTAADRLATYPDAPPPTARAPRQSIGYYLDGGASAPQVRRLGPPHTRAGLNPTTIDPRFGPGLAWGSIPKPDRIAAERAAANKSASLDRFGLIHVRAIPLPGRSTPTPMSKPQPPQPRASAGVSNRAPKYWCEPEKFCIRVP